MAELRESIRRLIDADLVSLNTEVQVGGLMRWLSFVAVAMASTPETFEGVYEAQLGPEACPGAAPWAAAAEELLNYNAHIAVASELAYCRLVDRYLFYLSLVAQCIYEHVPALLPDAKTRISDVLSYGSLDELVHERARQAAFELTFNSTALVDTTFSLAGVSAEYAISVRAGIEDAVETRNALVHRSGEIDNRFVERRPHFKDRLGEKIVISAEELLALTETIDGLRETLDRAVAENHGISICAYPLTGREGTISPVSASWQRDMRQSVRCEAVHWRH